MRRGHFCFLDFCNDDAIMKIRESKGGVKIEKNKIFVYFAHSIAFIDPTRLRRLSDTPSYYSARRALRPILLCEACCPAWGGWRLLYELCIVRLIDRVKRKNTEARRRRRKYRYGRLFYSQRKKLKALLSSCSRAYRMRRGMSSRATPCSRRWPASVRRRRAAGKAWYISPIIW